MLIRLNVQWAFIDPTHIHYFTTQSFSYFDEEHIHSKLYRYSDVRFTVEKIIFNEDIVRPFLINLVRKFANRYMHLYEKYVSPIVPLDTLTFYLRTQK